MTGYYDVTTGRPPHGTLLTALALFEAEPRPAPPRQAVDLGCGAGRDTLELLRRGWRVLAVDAEAEAIARVVQATPPAWRDRLTVQTSRFEVMRLPPAALVNASASLPFCDPARFAAVWARIVAAIRPGGRFAGHFFGERDAWAARPDVTCLTRSQVEALFVGFEVEHFEEDEHDGHTARGTPKRWHKLSVVARKRLTTDEHG